MVQHLGSAYNDELQELNNYENLHDCSQEPCFESHFAEEVYEIDEDKFTEHGDQECDDSYFYEWFGYDDEYVDEWNDETEE